jgi:hypothetical protein
LGFAANFQSTLKRAQRQGIRRDPALKALVEKPFGKAVWLVQPEGCFSLWLRKLHLFQLRRNLSQPAQFIYSEEQ